MEEGKDEESDRDSNNYYDNNEQCVFGCNKNSI